MKRGHNVNETHLSRGGNQHYMCGGCSLQVPACLRWVTRLLEKWYTGRFSVPYFILIFANVKIKDESELQQGFNKQEKTHTHRVDRYCLETVTFELLRSNF